MAPKAEKELKSTPFSIWLSASQASDIEAAAAKEGLAPRTWARVALLKVARGELVPAKPGKAR